MSNLVEGSNEALDLSGVLAPLADEIWNEAGVSLPSLPSDGLVFDNLLFDGHTDSQDRALEGSEAPALACDADFPNPLPNDPSAADLSLAFECEEGFAGVMQPALPIKEEDTEVEGFNSGASDTPTAATEATEDTIDERLNADALAEYSAASAPSPPCADRYFSAKLFAEPEAASTTNRENSANVTPSKVTPPSQTRRRRSMAADAAQDAADAKAIDLLGMVYAKADLSDDDYLLNMCATTAESSKQALRDSLKDKQREEEATASGSGTPLTSSQKERTRSRRESAVTRRRAEVYLRQLEAIVRQVPALQRALAAQIDFARGSSGDVTRFPTDGVPESDKNFSGEGPEDVMVKALSPDTARVSDDLERLELGFNDN